MNTWPNRGGLRRPLRGAGIMKIRTAKRSQTKPGLTQANRPPRKPVRFSIDQLLHYHLPRCDCLGGALRTPNAAHAALVPLLEILRTEGIIARPPAPTGPIAEELRCYDAHMRDARGLTSASRSGRLRIVERLLVSKFAGRRVVVGELQTDDAVVARQHASQILRVPRRQQIHSGLRFNTLRQNARRLPCLIPRPT